MWELKDLKCVGQTLWASSSDWGVCVYVAYCVFLKFCKKTGVSEIPLREERVHRGVFFPVYGDHHNSFFFCLSFFLGG